MTLDRPFSRRLRTTTLPPEKGNFHGPWSIPGRFHPHVGRSIVCLTALVLASLSFIAMKPDGESVRSRKIPPPGPSGGRIRNIPAISPVAGQSLQGKASPIRFLRSFHHARDGGIARRSLDATTRFRWSTLTTMSFMMFKTGAYTPCVPFRIGPAIPLRAPNAWNTEVWNGNRPAMAETAKLVPVWIFCPPDWTPVPNDYTLGGWEPLVPTRTSFYLSLCFPGAGRNYLSRSDPGGPGWCCTQINPFGASEDLCPSFVGRWLNRRCSGQTSINNVIQLVLAAPWSKQRGQLRGL